MTAVKIAKGNITEVAAGAVAVASGETVIRGSHWKLLTKEDKNAEKETVAALKAEDKRASKGKKKEAAK